MAGGFFRRRKGRLARTGKIELHVDDASFDAWPVVADYTEITVAKAFCQQLREAGYAAELTSDWPLDQFGHGDISLRVHPEEDQFDADYLLTEQPETDHDPDEEFDDWLRD
ncbi:MAG TPA: hypothetical protein VGO97_00020 [Solirubrobacterales bacterium]|nr:hypothetical protein [Solirubrobacterales bacterium]